MEGVIMKKFRYYLIVLTVLSSLFIFSTAQASGPDGEWTTNISCQNHDTQNAVAITIRLYDLQGDEKADYNTTIEAGKSINIITSSAFDTLPDDFVGSMVLSSQGAVTCAAEQNTNAIGSMSNPYRFAASKGFSTAEASPTVYVSQLEKNFYDWNSYMAIQNTESSSTDVTVTYVDRAGTAYPNATEKFTIPAQSSHVIYLDENPDLPDMFLGGATITADDGTSKLVVTATFYNSAASYQESQIHAYNGATQGSNTLYAPYLVRQYYGYNSGMMIQNIGSKSTSFKIVFTFAGTDYEYQYPGRLAPGEVKDFYLPDVEAIDAVDSLEERYRFGKAVITATDVNGGFNASGLLTGNINQDNRGGKGIPEERVGQGATYGAFLSTAGSQNIYIAKWMSHVGSLSSGFNISNFSGTDGRCDVYFVDDPDATMNNVLVPANSFFSIWAPNVANLDSGYNAGVRIECTVDVFVITNASADPGSGKYGDSFYQMNAGTD